MLEDWKWRCLKNLLRSTDGHSPLRLKGARRGCTCSRGNVRDGVCLWRLKRQVRAGYSNSAPAPQGEVNLPLCPNLTPKKIENNHMQRLLGHCTRDIATTGWPTSTSARSAPYLLRARDSQPLCGCNSNQVQGQPSSLKSALQNRRYLKHCR